MSSVCPHPVLWWSYITSDLPPLSKCKSNMWLEVFLMFNKCINSRPCLFDWFRPKSTCSNLAKGCESIAYPIRVFCCFRSPIHSTRAWDSRINSDVDNWLVTNTSVCSQWSPGDRGPALSRMRGLFCFAVYRGQAIKLEWKERSPLLALVPPPNPH